jgi:hypothetical protein
VRDIAPARLPLALPFGGFMSLPEGGTRRKRPRAWGPFVRADDGDRTRDPQLGKLMLYRLSYVRVPLRVTNSELAPFAVQPRGLPLVYRLRASSTSLSR